MDFFGYGCGPSNPAVDLGIEEHYLREGEDDGTPGRIIKILWPIWMRVKCEVRHAAHADEGAATICVFLCSIVVCGEAEAKKGGQRTIVWWAPDSSWAVGGFGKLRPGLLEQILAAKPGELDELKVYELEFNERASGCAVTFLIL